MALTRGDLGDLLQSGLRTEFDLAYRTQIDNDTVQQIATVINTTQPIQKYGWLGNPPPMREFLDERRLPGLAVNAITIEDKVFESTIAIDRKAIEDSQLDMIRLRVQDLAARVATHRQQIAIELLLSGNAINGYDGSPFFGDHLVNGATVSNKLTELLSSDALTIASQQMMQIPDEYGVPLGVFPDTLVVGPANYWNALALITSDTKVFDGGAFMPTDYVNVFNGKLKVVVSPFIKGANEQCWFLLDTKRPMRSIILQQRSDIPVEFTALDQSSGSESAFLRDKFLYGVRARYNVGLGLWQTAVMGVA